MRQEYGVLALDLNVFIRCEKHLESHGCRAEGLRLRSGCLDSVAEGLTDFFLASPEETVLLLLNMIRGTGRLEECSYVLKQLIEELIAVLYGEATSTSIAVALELQKLQRILEQSQRFLGSPLLRHFIESVEECERKPLVKEAVPDTVKCHDVIRAAICMLERAGTPYAPCVISIIFCTRENLVDLNSYGCRVLCPVDGVVIAQCMKRRGS